MRRTRGSVVIVTLWTLAILFLLAIGLAYRVGLELRMVQYGQDRLKAFYIAKGGLERAMSLLLKEGGEGVVDSFQDSWSQDEALFKESVLGDGSFTIRYTRKHPDGTESARYGMEDEESRIPLNAASEVVLQRVKDLDEKIALSLRVWRGDKDISPDQLTEEKSYYSALEKPYSLKGEPFESVEELLLVRGMTPALFGTMKTLFTVYGSGKVNLNTASVETLKTLGLDQKVAERFAEAREGDDGLLGTEDDAVLQSPSELISMEMMNRLHLDQDGQIALNNFLSGQAALLSVQSTAFRANLEGHLLQGHVTKKMTAVLDRFKGKGTVPYWHEE